MPSALEQLQALFEKPVCLKATGPLKKGLEIAIQIPGEKPMALVREKQGMTAVARAAVKPDMSFVIPRSALESVAAETTQDVGEIGIAILRLMADGNEDKRITAKVHIGPVDLFLKGYLAVLSLGGSTVMKFLASKGFSSLSKVREGISKMKE